MSRQQGHSQQLLQVTQELAEYKGYLSEVNMLAALVQLHLLSRASAWGLVDAFLSTNAQHSVIWVGSLPFC